MRLSLLQGGKWSEPVLEALNRSYEPESIQALLTEIVQAFYPAISFANSFGLEDLVLLHMLLELEERPEVFVLDTGRLHPETYDLIDRWRIRFGCNFRILSPSPEQLEPFVAQYGPNAFYESVAHRHTCCEIRKLMPLERALKGQKAWLTGLRREQSKARSKVALFELDSGQRLKINPLINWSLDEVWLYIKKHELPYNPLHDRSYPSIGCAPCTRAVAADEDMRAGRWWWEVDAQRECGLHLHKNKERSDALKSPR